MSLFNDYPFANVYYPEKFSSKEIYKIMVRCIYDRTAPNTQTDTFLNLYRNTENIKNEIVEFLKLCLFNILCLSDDFIRVIFSAYFRGDTGLLAFLITWLLSMILVCLQVTFSLLMRYLLCYQMFICFLMISQIFLPYFW